VVIVATEPTKEAAASTSAAPPATSEQTDTTAPAIVPTTESTPRGAAETIPSRIGTRRFSHALRQSPKFASNHTHGSFILYGLGKFAGAFAELPTSKHSRKTSRSSVPHAANANERLRRKNGSHNAGFSTSNW
jgi:hypothetical protein